MSKLRIAVIYGGPSAEHEVSVESGKLMVTVLDKDKYDVHTCFISKEGEWLIDDKVFSEKNVAEYIKDAFDFVLIALHGTYGEDGSIQKLFENNGIKFNGSGSRASKLAMNKAEASKVFKIANLKTPEEILIHDDNHALTTDFTNKVLYPLFVKPVKQGSSVGVSKVMSEEELPTAIDIAKKVDDEVLVQESIEGREVSCGVVENKHGKLIALPPTELIIKNADFFDYEEKYSENGADEITPPKMSPGLIKNIQDTAKEAHNLIGCEGYSRTDMIVKNDEIYVIEINTLPGMAPASILPKQAKVAGISLGTLMDYIIMSGLKR